MPDWLKWLLLVLLVAANVVLFILLRNTRRTLAEVRETTTQIHVFLGSNRGSDPTVWSGFLGTEKQNNKDIRGWLGSLRCRIEKLEKKEGPGTPCPPDGPPGTVPKDDGTYPP